MHEASHPFAYDKKERVSYRPKTPLEDSVGSAVIMRSDLVGEELKQKKLEFAKSYTEQLAADIKLKDDKQRAIDADHMILFEGRKKFDRGDDGGLDIDPSTFKYGGVDGEREAKTKQMTSVASEYNQKAAAAKLGKLSRNCKRYLGATQPCEG